MKLIPLGNLKALASCAGLAAALLGGLAPDAAAQEQQTALERFLSPRAYGRENAPNNVQLMLTVGNLENERLFQTLYPKLQPAVEAGKVRLDLHLWGHASRGFPVFLVAQCLEPAVMPRFLYEVFALDLQTPFDTPADAHAAAVNFALRDPALKPASMSPQDYDKLLGWCLSQRRAALINVENSRHNFIYTHNLEHSGVTGTVAIVNKQVIDGDVTPEAIFSLLNDVEMPVEKGVTP